MTLPNFIKPLPLPPNSRIVVAMSGGVDSSATAALCHALGYDTIGVTLQLYDAPETPTTKACCAGIDIRDAKQTAEKIGFPHYTLNHQSQFKQSVIDEFADSYLRGETPVPCIRCNQTVKFTDLLKIAKDLSATALITGHYARKITAGGKSQLLAAKDTTKDQSYFLFATTQEQLDFLHFPLGDLHKTQTRELARHFNLPTAEKPESQDICFVGKGGYGEVIRKLHPHAFHPGDIIHIASGETLGQHNGIADYTIGQRKGLRIGGRDNNSTPLYVVAINADKNQVIVGEHHHLAVTCVILNDINWLGNPPNPPHPPRDNIGNLNITTKFRSTMQPVEAIINPAENGTVTLTFADPQYGVSAGQACVFYDGDRVLGGGWIKQPSPPSSSSQPSQPVLEETA